MDKETLERINDDIQSLPCPFEKTLLAVRSQCLLTRKIFIAERESMQCTAPQAHQRCHAILELVRSNSRFTFGLRREHDPLPHRKQMRLQEGTLRTLANALYGDNDIATVNINTLLTDALQRYHSIDKLPIPDIVRTLAK